MDEELRGELLAMRARDRRTRSQGFEIGGRYGSDAENVERVHRENALRLKEIVDQHGWPGTSLVGEDGCDAAWVIAQHAISLPEIQKDFLRRVQEAVDRGDAPHMHEAFLLDRILFNQDRPQLYGLVFDWNAEGQLSAWIDVDDLADQRRRELGLPTVEEATEEARSEADRNGERPPEDIDEYHRNRREWARETGWLD